MENDILFSIIIPTYNNADLIGRCLDSIVSQTYTNWEAIIINNYSTDSTIEVVNSYNEKRFKLINFSNNGIIAASRNRGLKEASGEWIAFLDSDDWWTPDKLAKCHLKIDEADFIYHRLSVCSLVKVNHKFEGRSINGDYIKDLLLNGNAIPNSSAIVKRSVIEKVGYISEEPDFVACEDYDYWLRIAEVSVQFLYLNETLGFYWIGNNTSSTIKMIDKRKLIFEKYRLYLSNSEYLKLIYWWTYKSARIYHKTEKNEEAKQYYKNVFLKCRFDNYFFRSILFFFILKFNIKL